MPAFHQLPSLISWANFVALGHNGRCEEDRKRENCGIEAGPVHGFSVSACDANQLARPHASSVTPQNLCPRYRTFTSLARPSADLRRLTSNNSLFYVGSACGRSKGCLRQPFCPAPTCVTCESWKAARPGFDVWPGSWAVSSSFGLSQMFVASICQVLSKLFATNICRRLCRS